MTEILSFMPPMPVLAGQLLIGLINGSFYALLSLGLAIIFGLLQIVNFAHGAQYMLGALCSYVLLTWLGIGYWPALILTPLIVGGFGVVLERLFIQRMYHLHHMYGMLLTFGFALVIEGLVRQHFGSSGNTYPVPSALTGGWKVAFTYLPAYRAWVIGASLTVCILTWYLIEKTRLGSVLRAATENPDLTRSFSINVPRLITLTYGFAVALAALAGTMAAPIYQINAQMGGEIIIVVFAVVVIGGMGSIKGAIIAGFGLGIAEGLTKTFYPQASTTIVFIIMVLVLLVRPAGLFGNTQQQAPNTNPSSEVPRDLISANVRLALLVGSVAIGLAAPFVIYPVFGMKVLCFALFASAFNLLLGFGGLLSFGHAAFYGSASYVVAYTVKSMGFDPILGILAGMVIVGLMGLAFGYVAIRRQGIYFAMITLALAQMVYFFAVQAPFTHNDEGIQGVPRGHAFGLIGLSNQLTMYYFVFGVVLLGLLAVWRIVNSPFGYVLKSIRENEARATSLGYDTDRCKLLAFVLSAVLASVAGGLDALVFQLASLTNVHWAMSGHALLMSILGGVGTLSGPIVGAIIVAGMENYLASLGSWLNMVHGMIFILCVLLFRRGVVGGIASWLSTLRPASRSKQESTAASAVIANS
jgi:branched-chain amino acid transport system permease protein